MYSYCYCGLVDQDQDDADVATKLQVKAGLMMAVAELLSAGTFSTVHLASPGSNDSPIPNLGNSVADSEQPLPAAAHKLPAAQVLTVQQQWSGWKALVVKQQQTASAQDGTRHHQSTAKVQRHLCDSQHHDSKKGVQDKQQPDAQSACLSKSKSSAAVSNTAHMKPSSGSAKRGPSKRLIGVTPTASSFRANVYKSGKQFSLGMYDSAEHAALVVDAANIAMSKSTELNHPETSYSDHDVSAAAELLAAKGYPRNQLQQYNPHLVTKQHDEQQSIDHVCQVQQQSARANRVQQQQGRHCSSSQAPDSCALHASVAPATDHAASLPIQSQAIQLKAVSVKQDAVNCHYHHCKSPQLANMLASAECNNNNNRLKNTLPSDNQLQGGLPLSGDTDVNAEPDVVKPAVPTAAMTPQPSPQAHVLSPGGSARLAARGVKPDYKLMNSGAPLHPKQLTPASKQQPMNSRLHHHGEAQHTVEHQSSPKCLHQICQDGLQYQPTEKQTKIHADVQHPVTWQQQQHDHGSKPAGVQHTMGQQHSGEQAHRQQQAEADERQQMAAGPAVIDNNVSEGIHVEEGKAQPDPKHPTQLATTADMPTAVACSSPALLLSVLPGEVVWIQAKQWPAWPALVISTEEADDFSVPAGQTRVPLVCVQFFGSYERQRRPLSALVPFEVGIQQLLCVDMFTHKKRHAKPYIVGIGEVLQWMQVCNSIIHCFTAKLHRIHVNKQQDGDIGVRL